MCAPESAGREPEETMVLRRLLLVGEGNFSFTASLIDTLDPGVSVTATCLQQPDHLDGDPVTQENLQRLRERGNGSHPSARPRPGRGGVACLEECECASWRRSRGSTACPCLGWIGVLCLSGLQILRCLLVCISTFFARYRSSFWCGLHPAGTRLAGTRQRL